MLHNLFAIRANTLSNKTFEIIIQIKVVEYTMPEDDEDVSSSISSSSDIEDEDTSMTSSEDSKKLYESAYANYKRELQAQQQQHHDKHTTSVQVRITELQCELDRRMCRTQELYSVLGKYLNDERLVLSLKHLHASEDELQEHISMLEDELTVHDAWNEGVKTREYIDKIRLAEEVSQYSSSSEEEENGIERHCEKTKDTTVKPMEYIALKEAVPPEVQCWPAAA